MIKMYEVVDSKDGNWYSLDDMIEMYDNQPTNYHYVHTRLKCPSCGERIITCHISEDDAYIESKRALHKKKCDFYGFKLNQNKIKKRLNEGDPFASEYQALIANEPITNKAIGRKSINRRLCEDDIFVYKLFYGQVLVKTAYTKDGTKYKNFSIKAPKGNAITLSFQAAVFSDLAPHINFLENNIDKVIDIYFIASIKQIDDYYNAVIDKKSQIIIKHASFDPDSF